MTDKKFMLIGLDDDKSRYIAEILKNKTCKKILDYLAEIKEASEKDISESLKIPINTAEYNLNKLIKAGLVEKTKNFFWSVKGKKIPMYKLAKKHIIISTQKSDINYIKNLFLAVVSGFLAVLARFFIQNSGKKEIMLAESADTLAVPVIKTESLSFLDRIIALPPWIWFLAGVILFFIFFFMINVRRLKWKNQ